MKKIITLSVALILALALFAGCANNEEPETTTEEKVEATTDDAETSTEEATEESEDVGLSKTVAFMTFTTEGDYWKILFDVTEQQLNLLGYEMEIINADMDLTLQIEQIDNAVTQGYAGILLIAVDPNGVADACKRAVRSRYSCICIYQKPR